MYIKVQFLKDGQPKGREYTYSCDIVGQIVLIDNAKAIITGYATEEEVESYKDKIKSITVFKIGDDDAEESV